MKLIKLAAGAILSLLVAAGCQNMGGYGEAPGVAPVAGSSDYQRQGRIVDIERINVDDDYRMGLGTIVGAVAGGLLGHQVGGGSGQTAATIAGTIAGGAAGTAAESKLNRKPAQRVTVRMNTGGTVTVVQPPNADLREGMQVAVVGRGESARVVRR